MGHEEIKAQLTFERNVELGDKCMAHWTSCGSAYSGRVEVTKLNDKSFRVKLLKANPDYPEGFLLNIPNFTNIHRWAWDNRLAPLPPCTLGHCAQQDVNYGGGMLEPPDICPVCGARLGTLLGHSRLR